VLAYADDLAFVARSESELTELLTKLDLLDKTMKVNKSKSAILPLRKTTAQGHILGYPIVQEYKYLGIQIAPKVTLIRQRVESSVRKACGHWRKHVWRLGLRSAHKCIMTFLLAKTRYLFTPLVQVGLFDPS